MTEQTLTIRGWHPEQLANGPHEHWATKARKKRDAARVAYLSALGAEWVKVPGRVRLEIVFVFPQRRRRDPDNLYARAKGLIDGVKEFFEDDDADHLDLHVSALVQPKTKETRLRLMALSPEGNEVTQ